MKVEKKIWPVKSDDTYRDSDDRALHHGCLRRAVTAMTSLAVAVDCGGLSMAQIASALAQEACALETKLVDVRRASTLVNKMDKAEY